ncbi:MAG TPA: tetratricopeptide repeat protein [Bryobacteraceae bacterium]|nr:tetratricopeptide repeat protein [Bryobacteraceae bacterium]
MKKKKRQTRAAARSNTAEAWPSQAWLYWLIGLGALCLVFEAYGPSLHGPFVLDDLYLPYADAHPPHQLLHWVYSVRPLLMFSYWVNYQIGAGDPHVYHTTNVLLHFVASSIVALIAARLLLWAGVSGTMRLTLAVFSGGLFLLHPLQTESVAYVASRSDVLSVLFYYAAFAVFIYSNRETMSILRAIAVVGLFLAAAATKEHTLTLPVLILMTDYYWHRGGVRKNATLYGLLAIACAAGAVAVVRVLQSANTAGFSMKDLSPAAYFFTQCRVIWIYVRMFFLPIGQNVDPDVPISQGLMDHGAVIGLAALLAVMAAAWIYRKRWPLASFGVFVFLLLIAPTSSVIPIRDVVAERRAYLPFLGLVLIVLEVLRQLELRQMIGVAAAVLTACTALTYQRSEVWSSSLALWTDSVSKSPRKMRPMFHLAFAQYQAGDCAIAVHNFEAASRLDPPDYRLLVDWANALDCAGREDDAAEQFKAAIRLSPGLVEAYVGLSAVYGKQRKLDEALQALETAQTIDPNVFQIYVNRGGVYELLGNTAGARREYQHALQLDPSNSAALGALQRLRR